jgi:hypothetical protein
MKYRNIEIKNIPSFQRGSSPGREDSVYGLIDFCIDNVKEDDTILELGCLNGASTSVFSFFAKKVISVDVNFSRLEKDFLEKHKNVELIQKSSLDVSDLKIRYDLLYIDTVHEYNHCTKELDSLYEFCRSNPKRIGGHDYDFVGVKSAVNDFFGRKPTKIYDDNSWYYETNLKSK